MITESSGRATFSLFTFVWVNKIGVLFPVIMTNDALKHKKSADTILNLKDEVTRGRHPFAKNNIKIRCHEQYCI
jgi:hypothetical protein